jgi:hypothetical protein
MFKENSSFFMIILTQLQDSCDHFQKQYMILWLACVEAKFWFSLPDLDSGGVSNRSC